MFNIIFVEIKNWYFGEVDDKCVEFERMESKHTRIHHDEDIYEIIRVH